MGKDSAQIQLLRDLFEAHIGPLRDDIKEIKKTLPEIKESAEKAHTRIDMHESKFSAVWTTIISIPILAGVWTAIKNHI